MMRDPEFVSALRLAVSRGQLPVALPSKTLSRKKLPNYFREAIRKSILVHSLLLFSSILYVFLSSFFGLQKSRSTLTATEQRTAIRVEVLDLPSKTLNDLKEVDISERAVEKVKENALPEDAMILKSKDENKQKIHDVRNKLRTESRRKQLIENLKQKDDGVQAESGRAKLAGNILSEGYSLTGDVATDKEVHSGKVKDHVMRFWKVPAWMAASKQYRAEIIVKLDPKGKVISKDLVTKSGNSEFDRYALQSIEAADPFPPPPDSLKMLYLEEGILCAFPE